MEDHTFSFLNTQPEEQEEFLQKIKEFAQNVNMNNMMPMPIANEGDFVENIFSFVPLEGNNGVSPQQCPSSPASPLEGNASSTSNSPAPMPLMCTIGNAEGVSHPRQWRLIHLSPLLATRPSLTMNGTVVSPSCLTVQQIMDEIHVEIRTRSEKPSHTMPERLYSSLKYELKQQVSLTFSDSQVLMAKVQVVSPSDPSEEMLKTNGQSLIKGIQDMCVLSKTSNGYDAKFKIQFTDVSYHFENKHFALKISYYDPSINIQEPILIVVSSPFKVFARRPSKKSEKKEKTSPTPSKTTKTSSVTTTTTAPTTKRKAVSTEEIAPSTQPPNKKQKLPQTKLTPISPSPLPAIELKKSVTMKDFMDCLELLSAFKNALPKEELAAALKLAQQKLFNGLEDFESKFLAP